MDPQTQKRHPLQTIKQWVKHHKTASYGIAVVLALSVTSGVAFLLSQQEPKPTVSTSIPAPKPVPPPIFYSPMTGEVVASEADTTKPATAVMIENSPDARPQSGLKEAEVVYEAIAEGGITRFLALYQQNKPKLIGPVRSLRPYYVSWLTPYDASVAHVGGSSKALKTVRNGNYRDVDQFFNAPTYWRATDRYAPHNVYTNFKRLDALNKTKGYESSSPKPMSRTDKEFEGVEPATTVNVNMSGPTYNSSYSYDSKAKLYNRSQAGAPHNDREKGRITAKVVIALKTPMRQVFEDGYRESITTTGTGKAHIFADGTVLAVDWHKAKDSRQYTFTRNGTEVQLPRGTTWIAAVPESSGSVTWK